MLNRKRTVLIVEDELIIRTTLHEILQGEGYDVTSVDSTREGLDLVRARDLAVTVCDV